MVATNPLRTLYFQSFTPAPASKLLLYASSAVTYQPAVLSSPLGYDYVHGKLVINEYAAMIIREIYKLYLSGMSTTALYDYICATYPNSRLTSTSSIITNVLDGNVYCGIVTWQGKQYKGQHEAIVSIEEHEKVAELRKKRSVVKAFEYRHLLSGIIYCGHCGARMFGRRVNEKYTYYMCYSRSKSRKYMVKDKSCKMRTINTNKLDKYVIDQIKQLKSSDVTRTIDQKEPNNDHLIIKKRIKEIDRQLEHLVDLYQLESIPFDILNGRIKKLNEEKQAIRNKIDSMLDTETKDEKKAAAKRIIKSIAKFDWASATLEKKRKIINSLITKITINGHSVEIDWNF